MYVFTFFLDFDRILPESIDQMGRTDISTWVFLSNMEKSFRFFYFLLSYVFVMFPDSADVLAFIIYNNHCKALTFEF